MAASRATVRRAPAPLPPPEDLPTVEPEPLPSAIELLVRAYDGRHILEWLVAEALLRAVAPAFQYLFGTKSVRDWARKYVNTATLHNPPPKGCVLLDTPALQLEHPQLGGDHTYLLVPGGQGRELWCIVVLDHKHLREAQAASQKVAFTAFHVATLERGTLFAPEICQLIMHTLVLAAMSTETQVTYKVVAALYAFDAQLRELWTLRGKPWGLPRR